MNLWPRAALEWINARFDEGKSVTFRTHLRATVYSPKDRHLIRIDKSGQLVARSGCTDVAILPTVRVSAR